MSDDRAADGQGAAQREPESVRRRTGEIELLLSGAVAFALLKAPAVVDDWYIGLDPRLGGRADELLFFAFYYAKLVLYAGAVTFLSHLAVRAYWVALVGLHSAFPGGIDWDRSDIGPIGRREYEGRLASLPRLIGGADRLASSIFAAGLLVVLVLLASVIAVWIVQLTAWVLGRLTGVDPGALAIVIGAIILLPIAGAPLVDKHLGARMKPDAAGERVIRGISRFYFRSLGMAAFAPLYLTLFTNVRRRVAYVLSGVALVGLVTFFLFDVAALRDRIELSNVAYVPANAGGRGLDPRLYANLRTDPGRLAWLPVLESDVARGPYLRLFLPLDPDRDHEIIEGRCPDLAPLREGAFHIGGRQDAPPDSILALAIDCVASIWSLSLDGREFTPRYDFSRSTATGASGLLAHLPTRDLAPGRHLLSIRRERAPPDQPEDEPEEPIEYSLPFWR